jgi:hypothetical protein
MLQANNKAWSRNTPHYPEPRNSKVCLSRCWYCFGTIICPYSSTTSIMHRWSIAYGIVLFKPTIYSKHRGMLKNGAVLHHDNAQPHSAAEQLKQLKTEIQASLPPSIWSRSHSHVLIICITWTVICKQWRGEGHSAYVASLHATENILHRWHWEAWGLK